MDIQEISRNHNVLQLNVVVEQQDYKPVLDEKLREYRKQAAIPGFRKGMVPASLIRKQYGPGVLQQEAMKKALEGLMEYTEDRGYKVFGMPMYIGSNIGELEPLDGHDYYIRFEIGLIPELDFDFSKLPSLTRYTVTITDADVDEALWLRRYKHGARTSVGMVNDTDIFDIIGCFTEVDETGSLVPDGISLKLDFLTLNYRHFQAQLVGKQVGDRVETTFSHFFRKDATGRRVLHLSQEGYAGIKDRPLHFEITDIKHVEPAEVGPELYASTNGQPEWESEASLREQIKVALQATYDQRTEAQFRMDVHNGLLENFPFDFPEAFVARLLLTRFKDVSNEAELRQKHPDYLTDFKIYVLQERLKEAYPEIEVGEGEILEATRHHVKQWFLQRHGLMSPDLEVDGPAHDTDSPLELAESLAAGAAEAAEPEILDAVIDGVVQQLLSDEEYKERNLNELQANRVYEFLKDKYSVVEVQASQQAFNDR